MTIKHKNSEGNLYIYFCGELDEYTAGNVREQLDNLIENNMRAKSVIFDFCNLKFMDSTGIGVILGRYKKFFKYQMPFYIQNPTPTVDKVLELSGIYDIMPAI